eukprot:scaffold5162_cov25-Tisochrysis_lutea.AAC.1
MQAVARQRLLGLQHLLPRPPSCRCHVHSRQSAGLRVFSMFVGEGESLVRDVFRRARQASPSIIFLDEVRPC